MNNCLHSMCGHVELLSPIFDACFPCAKPLAVTETHTALLRFMLSHGVSE